MQLCQQPASNISEQSHGLPSAWSWRPSTSLVVLQNQREGMKGEFWSIYPHLDHHTGTEVPRGGKGGAVLSPTLSNSNRCELKWPLTAAEVSAHWPVNPRLAQYNLLLSAVTALQINLSVTVTGGGGLIFTSDKELMFACFRSLH